jgi:hypothetical protein
MPFILDLVRFGPLCLEEEVKASAGPVGPLGRGCEATLSGDRSVIPPCALFCYFPLVASFSHFSLLDIA